MIRLPQETHLLGPTYGPLSTENPDSLIILLHGYGASGDDLLALAYSWASHLPSTLFIAPNAPFPCETNPFGRQWFSLKDFEGERLWQEIEMVMPLLGEFVQEALSRYNLTWDQVAFAGFSQGAGLALSATLSFFPACCAVSYSGMIIRPFQKHIKYNQPLCLIHGDQDTVVPLSSFQETRELLIQHQVAVESWVCEGLGHGINPFGLEKGVSFLKGCFAQSKKKVSYLGASCEKETYPSV